MKNFAIVILAGLLSASGVEAQTYGSPPQAPVNPLTPSNRPPYDPSLYTAGDWVEPTHEQMMAFWPPRPLAAGISGSVTLDCRVKLDGWLAGCDITTESPSGYGYGLATLRLYRRYAHVDPASVEGGLKPESRRTFSVNWVGPPPAQQGAAQTANRKMAGDGQSAAPSPKPPSPPQNIAPRYITANWILPTPDQMKAFYPKKALQAGIEGKVVIDCVVKPDGWLDVCDMLPGFTDTYGLGVTAAALYERYAHTTPESNPGCRCRTQFTVDWRRP